MDKFDLEKLICAIELIVYKSLKENSDDSYSHKLIDLVDYVKPELTLDNLNKLTSIIGASLNHRTAVNDIELSTAFKLIGTIVSDERMIKEKPDAVITSFNWIVKFDHLLQDENDPHYDLQYSFLKCINKLCSTQSGCQFLAQKDDLLLIIFHLLTKSQGFYVQMEAQSVITLLLTNVLDKTDLSHRLQPYLHQMLLVNCKSHMECLNELVKNENMRQFLVNQFKLNSILISKLKAQTIKKDDHLLELFCQILATCDPPQHSIDYVTETLLEAKKLKSIMAFYSTLIQHHGLNYLDNWKLFTIYPLIVKDNNLNGQISGDEKTKRVISENLTRGEIMFTLRCISFDIINKLPHDDHLFLVNCIGYFLQQSTDKMVPWKLLSESLQKFDLLWKTSYDPIVIRRSLEIFLQLVNQIFCQQATSTVGLKSMIFSLFKSIREIIQLHRDILSTEMLIDICSKVNDILESASLKDNLDLVDSTLEIIIPILHSNGQSFVTMFPDLIKNFLNHWNNLYQPSNDPSLISSCIPILLCLDLYSPVSQLDKHSIIKNQTIPAILTNYLNEGEYLLRDSVIKAIEFNFPALIASDSWNHHLSKIFTKFYGLPMSQLIVSEIDSEVLSKILQIWISLIETITCKPNQDDRFNLIATLYQSGFFTSLWLLLKDELIIETIKSQAYHAVEKVSSLFQSINLTESDLINIFNDLKEPEFFITIEDVNHGSSQTIKDRERVIDDIFKDHATLPTQDLINVVTEELHGSKKLIKKKRDIGHIPVDLIASFFTKSIESSPMIVENASHQTFAILDDIIAARSFDTRIPSDCY